MKKLTPDDPEGHSPDIAAENLAKLKALFPEIVTEGPKGASVNVDVLKALVGDGTVTDAEEKYGLNWHGKRRARQLALTPSTGTLRPCPEESVDWDTTQNLMIEGDNLEVLKLLQKSYAGKVKLIYIDPPYNTGNDFIYPDDFHDNVANYLQITGQATGGTRLETNTEAGGRFHTRWLSMMYPRLILARSLLRRDGLIMISIDDHELAGIRNVCDAVFGEEAFLIQFVWRRRAMADSRNEDRASSDHEYVVCYKMPEARLKGVPIDREKYSNPDGDERGPWFSADLTGIANKLERPNLHYDVTDPATGTVYPPSRTRGWSCSRETMARLIAEGRVLWPSKPDGRPRHKKFLSEVTREETGVSSWLDAVGQTSEGTQAIQALFGEKVFPFAKPLSLMRLLLDQATPDRSGLVLDLFAGSGTTGQAVMEQNESDGGARRYCLVQLPEPTEREDYRTIADLSRERLRRSGSALHQRSPMFAGDLGFRVFKLDSTNLQEWKPNPDDLDGTLLKAVDHVKADRTEADLLYEVLLKLGLDLCVPFETRTIAGKEVRSVGGGVLMACLADKITREDVEALGQGIVEWRKALAPAGDTTCIFRDAAFADDVAKTNLASILEQNGIKKVRSL